MSGPIFVFDLHGVVFRPDYPEILRIIWRAPQKYKLVLGLCDPRFWITFFSLFKKVAVPEEYIMKISARISYLKSFVQSGIDLANAQKPQEATVALIQELSDRGIELYVFSNIGEKTYEQLVRKYPYLMGLFKGAMYATAADDYLKKPYQKAFEKYVHAFNQQYADLIFIDNKRKNIRVAKALGIDGILFKNPRQLRDEVIKREIL